MQIIVKSGGNQYHGSASLITRTGHFSRSISTADQIRRGAQGGPGLPPQEANRVWSDGDLNADVGGFIVPDKAWWYFSWREQERRGARGKLPGQALANGLGELHAAKSRTRSRQGITSVVFGHAGRNHQPNRLDPFGPAGSGLTAATAINESDESTSEQLAWGWVWKGEWNGVIGDNALIELRAADNLAQTARKNQTARQRNSKT